MTGIAPFRGEVVRQESAHDVVSPAYDAMTVAQRRQFRRSHPDSYLHVTRSAADEEDAQTVDHATLVRRGRESLERIMAKGVFVSGGPPAFYVYRLMQDGHQQDGLVCEVDSAYFGENARPHEATQPDRAALLAQHFRTVRAASSPIACTIRDDGRLASVLASACVDKPVLDIETADGLRQMVWRVSKPAVHDELEALVANKPLFIVDGHHRAAANGQLREGGLPVPVLATIFPEQSLHLVGFHRLVTLPAGVDSSAVVRGIARRFEVLAVDQVARVDPGHVALYTSQGWNIVRFDERPVAGGAQVLLGSLDPVVVEREILQGVVGRLGKFSVTYAPDIEPFTTIVDEAAANGQLPIFVPPVDIAEMMAVAEGGLIMPAKSTYFTPKVRSGLFLRELDAELAR